MIWWILRLLAIWYTLQRVFRALYEPHRGTYPFAVHISLFEMKVFLAISTLMVVANAMPRYVLVPIEQIQFLRPMPTHHRVARSAWPQPPEWVIFVLFVLYQCVFGKGSSINHAESFFFLDFFDPFLHHGSFYVLNMAYLNMCHLTKVYSIKGSELKIAFNKKLFDSIQTFSHC